MSTDGSNKENKKPTVTFFNDKNKQVETSVVSTCILKGDSTDENDAKLMLNNLKSFKISLENCLSLSLDSVLVMIKKEI